MRRKKTTKTFELTVERNEFFLVPKPSALVWCERCEGRVSFVTPAEAARSAGASLRTIFRRIEAAEIHFVETPSGRLLVCLDSLARFS